jgi:TPR repeat protein
MAAEQGDSDAQYAVGEAYYYGRGTAQDYAEAAQWYCKAAEQEQATSQFSLGVMYAAGEGVAQDYVEAVRWYRMAAEQGDSDAQYNLGCLYANGEGVPQDHAEAAQWYHKAAEQGYATAQFSLGVMYDDGKGVAHDEIEALRWYRMAAEQGNASAQFALGRMYEDGCGVAQDDAEAIRWYRLAAEHGLASAQTRLASAQTRLAAMFLDRRPQGPELNRLKPPSALRDVLARARRTGVSIVAKIKGVGMGAVGVLACVIAIALPFILLFGMTWVSVKLLPWLRPVIFWTLVVCVFLLGPTALFRRTRGFSAAGLMWASYIFGAVLWIWSLLVTLDLWGILAAVIGLLIMGVGIVPVAILAAIFHAQWAVLGDIAIGLVVTFGARVLALWLASKAERDDKETYIETREHTLNRMQELLSGRGLQICTAALLFVALANWPYGYYSFLRLAVCAAASVLAWRASKAGRPLWTLVMAGIALLFNPIIPVRFHRAEWAWIDAVAASVFLALPPVKKRQKGSA